MKKFRFRLQPLLRLRQQQQDQKQRRVGSLLEQIQEQQGRALELAEAVRVEGEELRRQWAAGRVDLAWVAQYRRYVTATQQAINERVRRVGAIQGDLQGARRELAEAAKQTKIMDKLQEKQRQRHDQELARVEAAEMDDVAMRVYAGHAGN